MYNQTSFFKTTSTPGRKVPCIPGGRHTPQLQEPVHYRWSEEERCPSWCLRYYQKKNQTIDTSFNSKTFCSRMTSSCWTRKTFSFTCSHPHCLRRWLWSWRQKYQPRPSGGAHECTAAHQLDAMQTVSQREMLGLIKRCRSTHLFWRCRCITSPPLWKRQWRCEGHVAEA